MWYTNKNTCMDNKGDGLYEMIAITFYNNFFDAEIQN